uniref:W2 domain-containing protein n=1 Tax=Meloidogyne javanica TaxID=6303 RepID=A0A915MJT0_MELJA
MQNKLEQVEVLVIISDFSLTEEGGIGDSSVFTLYEARLIDKCLEEISWLLSPNVIVAYGNNPKSVGEELLKKWSKRFKRLQYLSVEECKSINDILRQVEDRQLLKTDFLFVYNCATFCSVNLESWIEDFRALRKQNKNAVATLIYSEIDVDESSNNSLICFRTCTKKLKKIKEFPGNCSDISDEEENEEGEEENIESLGEGNNKQEFTQFILEVRESMQELFEKEQNTSKAINESEFSNLKLEISSCKLAYNVPMDELPRLIFLSFIGIPGVTQQLALFKKDFSTENENFCRILPNILHWLNQEKEFLEDEQIIL